MATNPLTAVAISGSPSRGSRSRLLLTHAVRELEAEGVATSLVDLAELPADALLGRRADPALDAAFARVSAARIVVASTPVYRATYSGLLKTFFDLLPQDALAGKLAIPIATGGGPAHLLAIDHGLRPLFASLGATTVAIGTYATDTQFSAGAPEAGLLARLSQAVAEAVALARAGRSAGEATDRATAGSTNHAHATAGA